MSNIWWYEYREPMYKVFLEIQYSVEIHQTINLQFRFERGREREHNLPEMMSARIE